MVALKSMKSSSRSTKGSAKRPQLPSSLLSTTKPAFSKSQSKSKAANKLTAADLYEYDERETVLKRGRSNVKLSLDREEAQSGFRSSDEEEEMGDGVGSSNKLPKLYGAEDDDEDFDSEDDEEIDSDEAFEEDDVDLYAGFTFRSSKKTGKGKTSVSGKLKNAKQVQFMDVDLDEDSYGAGPSRRRDENMPHSSDDVEDDEEGEDGDFIDVLDVMDGRGFPEEENEILPNIPSRAEKGKGRAALITGDSDAEGNDLEKRLNEMDSDDSDEFSKEDDDSEGKGAKEDSGDEEPIISGEEDEGEDMLSALANLDNFVSKLSTSKRKVDDEETQEVNVKEVKPKKKARFVQDVTEAGMAEGEFGARPSGSSKLSLDDLIVPLSNQSDSAVDSLKKAMKPLTTSSSKHQPLPAPLPTRAQEKLDREAAYEQTKKEADRWNETMQRIKEAEHLSFPLQVQKEGQPSNLELAAKFKPITDLESSVDKLLKTAKLREEDLAKTEELMMNNLSVEEVAERRNQLRKMRDLMFRADIKAKRVAKIKSKTYRRIRKKEKEKLIAKLDAGIEEDEEEERLKREVERARERATLKHKNTGKWAKAMKSREHLDEDQRRDINEMLEKGERLRQKIAGVENDGDSDEDGSDADGGDDLTKVSSIKAKAFDELDTLRTDSLQDEHDKDGSSHKVKSVFQMKFMKDAATRQNREVDQEIDDFRREIGDLPDCDDADHDIGSPAEGVLGPLMSVERVGGRMVFKPSQESQNASSSQTPKFLPPPPPSSISETSTLQSHDNRMFSPVNDTTTLHRTAPSLSQSNSISSISVSTATMEPNPWLMVGEGSSSKIARKKNELLAGRNVSAAQKSEARMKIQLSRSVEGRAQAADDATVELDEAKSLVVSQSQLNDAHKPKKRERKNKKKAAAVVDDTGGDESGSDGERDAQEEALLRGGKGPRAFGQKDLVARAFAGDNVVRDFEEMKRKDIEMDAPREEDTTLPGWGSWGGNGTKKAPPKPHLIKKIAGIDPKSRADYNKAHVIISEKRDKKAAKYAVKDLPYPYTSKAQFEQSMDTPLGTEWNTRLGFQRGTLPKVVKKMGTIINPLDKQF